MLNITLTITAAPELLAALSNFTTFISTIYSVQGPTVQQQIQAQQQELNLAPANVNPVYNQANTTPSNQIKSQPISVPVSVVPVPQQAQVQSQAVQTSTVPTSSQTYSMEQLAVAATQLVDAGRRSELVSLLQTFGVQALTALPKEQYGAFATQLRALGAKI